MGKVAFPLIIAFLIVFAFYGCYSSIPAYKINDRPLPINAKIVVVPHLTNSCNDSNYDLNDNAIDKPRQIILENIEKDLFYKINGRCSKQLIYGDKLDNNLKRNRMKHLLYAEYYVDGEYHSVDDTGNVSLPSGTKWNLHEIESDVYDTKEILKQYKNAGLSLQFSCIDLETRNEDNHKVYELSGSYAVWDLVKNEYVVEGNIGPRFANSIEEITKDVSEYVVIGMGDAGLCN